MPTQAEDAAAAAEIEQNYETMSMLKDDRIKRLVLFLRWRCEAHSVQVVGSILCSSMAEH